MPIKSPQLSKSSCYPGYSPCKVPCPVRPCLVSLRNQETFVVRVQTYRRYFIDQGKERSIRCTRGPKIQLSVMIFVHLDIGGAIEIGELATTNLATTDRRRTNLCSTYEGSARISTTCKIINIVCRAVCSILCICDSVINFLCAGYCTPTNRAVFNYNIAVNVYSERTVANI